MALCRRIMLKCEPMKSDLYTKVVLTVIAVALIMIVSNWYIRPTGTVQAQTAAQFSGVQFEVTPSGNYVFFDSRTGDIWSYDYESGPGWSVSRTSITKLGKPPVR